MGRSKTRTAAADCRAGEAHLEAAGLIAATTLATLAVVGCTATPTQQVSVAAAQVDVISLPAAKRQILADRARIWKDPGSIQSASIGDPVQCSHEPRLAASCVCIEANARNSYGGYTGIRRTIAVFPVSGAFDLLDGGILGFQQYCASLRPFPELEMSPPKAR